jgi:septin family protein
MLVMLTSRTASRSSPSLSVRTTPSPAALHAIVSNEYYPELELDEEGTRISLTIVDTPGFGDQIDNEAR